jgi:predicted DNA-binding protein (MmcQ/YjbR family)
MKSAPTRPRAAGTSDATLARLRELCQSLPDTSETSAWGHPNFKAGKRIFATYEVFGGRPSIAFRLDPTDVDLLLRRKQFFVTPYGRGQWVSLRADGRVSWRLVERLLERSYSLVMAKQARLQPKAQSRKARRPKPKARSQARSPQPVAWSLKQSPE